MNKVSKNRSGNHLGIEELSVKVRREFRPALGPPERGTAFPRAAARGLLPLKERQWALSPGAPARSLNGEPEPLVSGAEARPCALCEPGPGEVPRGFHPRLKKPLFHDGS